MEDIIREDDLKIFESVKDKQYSYMIIENICYNNPLTISFLLISDSNGNNYNQLLFIFEKLNNNLKNKIVKKFIYYLNYTKTKSIVINKKHKEILTEIIEYFQNKNLL